MGIAYNLHENRMFLASVVSVSIAAAMLATFYALVNQTPQRVERIEHEQPEVSPVLEATKAVSNSDSRALISDNPRIGERCRLKSPNRKIDHVPVGVTPEAIEAFAVLYDQRDTIRIKRLLVENLVVMVPANQKVVVSAVNPRISEIEFLAGELEGKQGYVWNSCLESTTYYANGNR